jgi:hypothetical protein
LHVEDYPDLDAGSPPQRKERLMFENPGKAVKAFPKLDAPRKGVSEVTS